MKIVELKDIKHEEEITQEESDFAINLLNNLGPADDLLFLGETSNCIHFARNVSRILPLTLSRDDIEEESPDFTEGFRLWMDIWSGPKDTQE